MKSMSARIARVVLPVLILAAGIGGMTALVKSKPEREPLGAEERAWTVAAVAVEPGTVTPSSYSSPSSTPPASRNCPRR